MHLEGRIAIMKNAATYGIAIAATVVLGMPAFADQTVTQMEVQTSTTQPVVQEKVITTSTPNSTTSSTQTKYTLLVLSNAPDDLKKRQADLNDRILAERQAGTITGAKADNLLNRLTNVATDYNMHAQQGSPNWKLVEQTYRAFDKIAHDLGK
jgi:hypothetical protein